MSMGGMIDGRTQEDSKIRKEIRAKAREEGSQEGKEEYDQEESFQEANTAQDGEKSRQKEGCQNIAEESQHATQGPQKEGLYEVEPGKTQDEGKEEGEIKKHPAFVRRNRPHTIDRGFDTTAGPEHDFRRRICIKGTELQQPCSSSHAEEVAAVAGFCEVDRGTARASSNGSASPASSHSLIARAHFRRNPRRALISVRR
jgi:hypothetical protein